MSRDDVINLYFDWLTDIVCRDRFSKAVSFRKLLAHLHSVEFTNLIERDENRAEEGKELRHRFAYYHASIRNAEIYLNGPCSVLEMIIALAIRCEENIMDDPTMGDRTSQWFWDMIVSLGLGSMIDREYDKDYVDFVIDRFLNREYEPNGKGGLFTINNCEEDLRTVEIWCQMCWYLDGIG